MGMLTGIRYLFQIPFRWFETVDARVFGDHPGTGIKFEPANDGSRAFMLDFDILDDRYGGGGGDVPTDVLRTSDRGSPDTSRGVAPTNPVTPASTTNINWSTAATALTSTWTAGGEKGLQIARSGRTVWDGATGRLLQFYRTWKYSADGRLVSVSKETLAVIDTAVAYVPS